jgi:ABC-type Zn uptake system ZnuABC Zn-binding protein ZnuA
MFKKLSVLTAMMCIFTLAGTVSAAQGKQGVKSSIANTEVISVNASIKQITVKDNIVFNVADNASIRKEGKPIHLFEIKPGDLLTIAYKEQDSSKLAIAIKVRTPNPKNN